MKFFVTQPINSRQKTNAVFLAFFFFILLALTFFIDPRDVSLLSCKFKRVTGYNCPTCGLSRSFYALANLNLYEAFSYHLLGPLLYLSAIVLFLKSTTEIVIDRKIKFDIPPIIIKIFIILLAVTWFVFWISNSY